MRKWEKRSEEVANLLNPAFCGEVIRRFVLSYQTESQRACPFPLLFLVLPLILHRETREKLPNNIRTKFLDWLHMNETLKISFAERARKFTPLTKEAITFLLQLEALKFDDNACLYATSSTIKFPAYVRMEVNHQPLSSAVVLGKWLVHAPSVSSLFVLLGIRP